jgi:hypothetical protein
MPRLQWTCHVGRQARRHHCCCCRCCQQQQAVGGCPFAMRVAAAGGRQLGQVWKERYAAMNASSKYKTRQEAPPTQARALCGSACTQAMRGCSADSVRVALSLALQPAGPASELLPCFFRDARFSQPSSSGANAAMSRTAARSVAVNLLRVAGRALLAHR